MEDINSIVMFDQAPAAEVSAPTGEVAATPAAQERDDQGKFKAKEQVEKVEAKVEPKVEAKAEPAVEQKVEKTPERGQMSAMLAERAKRQQIEQEAAQLRAE